MLQKQEIEMQGLKQIIKNHETDINVYKEQITELEMKLQSQNGPFNLNFKYNSEELQKSLQNKISQLEISLEKQDRSIQILEAEKQHLKEELGIIIRERDQLQHDNAIILTNCDEAQQQCQDLLNVIEMAKREHDHLKESLEHSGHHSRSFDFSKIESQDPTTLAKHLEKLKKMLVDKSYEIDSLNAKQKHYEKDLQELLTYRQLKCDMYKKEFEHCNNSSHTRDFLLMQNDLQNYQRTIDDRDQQILNLNSMNKDLQEKIKNMIQQTRNEIQNFSHKYSMPQLTSMSEELTKATETNRELNKKLLESEEKRHSLLQELTSKITSNENESREITQLLENEKEKNMKLSEELKEYKDCVSKLSGEVSELKVHNENLKSITPKKTTGDSNLKTEYDQLKSQLSQVLQYIQKNKSEENCSDLAESIKSEMDDFLNQSDERIEKGILEEKIISWKKLLDNIKEDKALKRQQKEVVTNLQQSQERIKELEDLLQDMKNAATIAEGEKCSIKFELRNCVKQLQESQNLCKNLELQLQQKEDNITVSQELENLKTKLELLQKDNVAKENCLKVSEQAKNELNNLIDKMRGELEHVTKEKLKLENMVANRSLDKELQGVHHGLEERPGSEKKIELQAELIKCELKLKDELQIEYQKRIRDIERQYQQSYHEKMELCKRQAEQLHEQDQRYREHLKLVMSECSKCTQELENEKLEIVERLNLLQDKFEKYKQSVVSNEEKYYGLLMKMEQDTVKNVNAWKKWSKQVVSSCLNIDELNKKTTDKILTDMKSYDAEVTNIEKLYNDKIKKKQAK
ncbi:early endosome antigen 1-like [Cylas formicarius]|uniref:early endosome antigen 1-like n=1 Tax=Cylas formicarius TaxID=197179 RepID=UPI002958C4F1|nr:early endosome antigen 1-like [Cylas formicarius]